MSESQLPTDDEFNSARDALREDYNEYRNSLAIRLLAMFGVLFTLLQAVQSSTKLSEIFPNLTIITFDVTIFGVNLATLGKLMLFMVLMMGLLFFAFRAFFKFTLASRYIMELYWFKREDFKAISSEEIKSRMFKERRWHIHLVELLSLRLRGESHDNIRKKMWRIIPYDFFMPNSRYERHGDFLCLCFAFLSTIALVMIIW